MDLIFDKELAETFSYWATTLGIIVALGGGIGAYWKYRSDQAAREWERARQSYVSFMDLAITHPEFCPSYWSDTAEHDPVAKNKYLWFMARFLWASEEVLLSAPRHIDWESSIRLVVNEHLDFFRSDTGVAELAGYTPTLSAIILKALDDDRTAKALERGAAAVTPVVDVNAPEGRRT